MIRLVQRILDEGVIKFQRDAITRARDSLSFSIEWFKRVHEYANMEEGEQRLHTTRQQLLVSSLEILQRELKVLIRLVDITLLSVKNSTNARPQNPPSTRPSPKT